MESLLWAVAVVIAALMVALLVRSFLVFVVRISSQSMLPALRPGQRILAMRVYNENRIKRGDVIIFRSDEVDDTLIKRVIGIRGDTVRVYLDGTVSVNGEEPYVSNDGEASAECHVPDEGYFVLGDNREESRDSRHWRSPCVKAESIIGKAIIIPKDRKNQKGEQEPENRPFRD